MIPIELEGKKLEQYKLNVSLYTNYNKELEVLSKKNKALKLSIPVILGHILFFILSIFLFYSFLVLLSKWNSTIAPILYMISFYGILFLNYSVADFIRNILSFGRFNELKIQIEKVEYSIKNSYELLKPFEKKISNYFEDELKSFFEKNLYKKRSGSQQFQESLSKFSSMIDEIKNVNLVTTRLYLSEYENYLQRRTIDHFFNHQKKMEQLDSIRNFARNVSQVLMQNPKEFVAPEKLYRAARKIDNWEEINKKRKMTGLKGQEITIAIEQEYFESINRNDLAQKVRDVSIEDGDGLGYDVLSFFEDGREKYIEVKSTTISLSSPFYVSRNELSFLKEHSEDAFIYRVLISVDGPQIKIESSREFLEKNELIPVSYIVKAK